MWCRRYTARMADDGARRSKRVTIRDVAKASNTSITTVSVSLSGRPGVSAETRAHVLEWANKLGWSPDRRAANLRRLDTKLVGVVYEVEHSFQTVLVDSLYVAAADRGLDLVLAGATPHHLEKQSVAELLRERAQCLILTGTQQSSEELGLIARRVPVLSLCRLVEIPGVDVVVSDDALGFQEAIGHLVALNHRDIVHLAGADGDPLAATRQEAYLEAMKTHGLAAHSRVLPGGNTLGEGAAAAERLVESGDLPSAVTCFNDVLASGLVRRLGFMGVRVPEDVSVVGFDDGPESRDPTAPLTTIVQDRPRLASAAMEILARRMERGEPVPAGQEEKSIVPTYLAVRESTGPAIP